MQKIAFIFLALLSVLSSCNRKGCTDPEAENYDERYKKDDGSCLYAPAAEITLNFQHLFETNSVSTSTFNQLIYQNENGNVMSITKLIYHISDVRFHQANGDSIVIDGYHLIDLNDPASLSYILPKKLAYGYYNAIGFNLGFVQSDNTSGAYSDLNAANWGWPESLGGGYHQLQIEGQFIETTTDTSGYAYHSGSAVRELVGSESIFHTNYIHYKIPVTEFYLGANASVEIKMNVAEWFKNPNLWDLNLLNNSLMGNYDAQLKIRANGADVFTVGAITQ
ncbi:MAG: hypothetical protein IPH24_17160 [Crocinitomicaceae bacterium]|nr:hypothetical protein [Crocinitomicaceae bacterium]